MSELGKPPGYMAQLLEELGWNQGTRIPLANAKNQDLENLLISRQNEIQKLKEALIFQNQKRADLNKYKEHVHTEYQENTRLLFAHKQQLEQQVKLKQLSSNEAALLEREIAECAKESRDIVGRTDKLQAAISRLLKKADLLKTDVVGERGALHDWRAALERGACDITAIEQFTKQDVSKAKELEYKRQKLKVEHDRMHDRLSQLVSNLSAEERACERISVQVIESMEQRKQMMMMWTGAVENLRQRDKEIRHIREDYAVLDEEANHVAEQCREQEAFCEQQRGNNRDVERENMDMATQLSQLRMVYQELTDINLTALSEVQSLQRELSNMHNILEKLHMENRRIMEEQYRKDLIIQGLTTKIQDLKRKLADTLDKTKSSEKRAKELEEMLNEEERYASQVTQNQQRAMHCSFVEQQKLLALKNEEKLFKMQIKAAKAIMNKLDTKQRQMEKNLQHQKETFYAISYQVETVGARVTYMEGAQTERECSAEMLEKENRLKEVLARHTARLALLERHSAKLHEDMRRLTRELEVTNLQCTNLQSRLKTSVLNVEGGEKEVRLSRDVWKRMRVDAALLRLRVAHATRAVAGLDDAAFSLDTQALQLRAAMNERLVEIAARRDMFNVQKRALFEDCGKLRSDIRERENRIDQLKKRYDIFIGSLGKDDTGQQLSVTFFKIKFAAERAELREKGAALDADIGRREKDVSALEATLRVVAAAHQHFIHHISPLHDNTPEIQEIKDLTDQYYEMRDELKQVHLNIVEIEHQITDQNHRLSQLTDKCRQLSNREDELENDLESFRDRIQRQEEKLQTATELVRHNTKRAKKLIEGDDQWRIFQMALWVRDYSEAAHNALQSILDACAAAPDVYPMFAALVSATDIRPNLLPHQKRLHTLVERILTDLPPPVESSASVTRYNKYNGDSFVPEPEDSIFSTSSESQKSGVSVATGYTRRLANLRRNLAAKVQESTLVEDIAEQGRRSTVSLRVISLGLGESTANIVSSGRILSRKSFN